MRKYKLFISATVVAMVTVMSLAPLPALADTIAYSNLGYPSYDARCLHTGLSTGPCANYDWAVSGNVTSPFGYGYRNCTDYVAWRLRGQGVTDAKTRGLGNGGQWADRAQNNGLTWSMVPKAGTAAVNPSGNFGHVAYVEAVNANGTITVSEYNKDTLGHGDTWTGRPVDRGFTKYVDFGISTDMFFIMTSSTSHGKVEIHSATNANFADYGSGQHDETWFTTGYDASRGNFQMVGRDLYFIKTKETSSGNIEIHTAMAGHYQNMNSSTNLHKSSNIGLDNAGKGWFQMQDVDGDGRQDLVFIKTKNTPGNKVEVHWRTAASNFTQGVDKATNLSTLTDANDGWFQIVGTSLFFIKTRATANNKVEVHWRTLSSNFQSGGAAGTWLNIADRSNGWFQMVGLDLFFIKIRQGTDPNFRQVEVHSARVTDNYNSGQHNQTYVSAGNQNNGPFQVGIK